MFYFRLSRPHHQWAKFRLGEFLNMVLSCKLNNYAGK